MSYDLKSVEPSPRDEVKAQLLKAKWTYRIRHSDGSLKRLPNTTLVGEFATADGAKAAFDAAIAAAKSADKGTVVVRKVVITKFQMAHFESDHRIVTTTQAGAKTKAENMLRRLRMQK